MNGWWAAAALSAIAAGALTWAPAPVLRAQTQVDAVISSGGGGAAVRYAVPDFAGATPELAAIGRTIGEVLWNDLNFEREFYMIPRDTYTSVPRVAPGAPPPFASWRELGADAVVTGTVERVGDRLRVDFRLFRVANQQQVLAQRYEGDARNPRRIAHRMSDDIFLQQRGLRGVAQTKLAFISDRNRDPLVGTVEKREVKEVYISDYDGFNEQRITVSRTLNLNPSWSPDAQALAYSTHSLKGEGVDIVVSRIYQGLLQRPAKGIGNNYLPAFSPDGTRIAFASSRDGNYEIYVANVDGSNLRRLTNNPAYDLTPTWSPSGAQIAFTSDRSGRAQVYMMNADGSGVELITRGEAEADRPTWSPAPFNEIAFSARSGGWYDIKTYNVATRRITQLTHNSESRGSNESPAFSPTGRHLAFMSTRTGSMQIFVMGRDGNGVRQITRTGNNQTPSWSAAPAN